MGWDHALSCRECRETLLNVARNQKLCKDDNSLDKLESFLNKHADHELVFNADDDWVRVPGAVPFEKDALAGH
jgi:hypothetical protein